MFSKVRDIIRQDIPTLRSTEKTATAREMFRHCGCIVILHEGEYYGLLTPKDLAFKEKTLVGDCLVPKPEVSGQEYLNTAIEKMNTSGYRALPCFDDDGGFLGVITIEKALESLCLSLTEYTLPDSVMDSLENSGAGFEKVSGHSLHEMSHHTKNPIQIILSSMHILMHRNPTEEQKELITATSDAALQLDKILSDLFLDYFRDAIPQDNPNR